VDFRSEWEKAKRGQQSALFASDLLYGVPQYRRKHTPVRTQPRTPYVRTRPVPTAPVWPEYQGHSAHRTQGYSPALFQKQHNAAMQAFHHAETTLTRLKERW
jgi:hypothetical protein